MQIDRTGRPGPAAPLRRRRAHAPFTPPANPPATEVAPDPPAAAACLSPLLDLAAAEPPAAPEPVPDATCAVRGTAVLDALAGLQMAALGGGGGAARQALADLAQSLPQPAEPGLAAILQAIAQRAAIELARAG
jgi:hypothetical protein